MKKEQIKSLLNDKRELLLTLIPIELRDEFRLKSYFAGGCIRSLLIDEPVNDYDVFFLNREFADIIKEKCKHLGFVTDNAISITCADMKFQLITMDAGLPYDVIQKFDFTMNMNFYHARLHIQDEDSIKAKKIRVNYKCRNPFDTFFRLQKFQERGYIVASQSDISKIATRLTQLKPIDSLEDFKQSTRQCGSSMIESGELGFLS